jgi:hypothetical protein
MEIQVKKAINILDGQHEGIITNIRYRSKPYEYLDLEIEIKQGEDFVTLKCGYPQIISTNSKLGYLLSRFGESLEEGKSIDPDKVLIGKQCRFKTMTETNIKGKFAKIIPDSIMPK